MDGSIQAGDVGTVTVGGVTYTYTVLADDTLASVRDAFVALINADTGSPVTASRRGRVYAHPPAGENTRPGWRRHAYFR